MTIEGVDYSLGRPDPVCLFNAGKRFACRYVSSPGGIDKDMSPTETRALTAAGIAIVTNYEDAIDSMLNGFAFGKEKALMSDEHARLCGMPSSKPIYFSVDFDASTSQLENQITDTFHGCIDAIGLDRVGAYGGLRTIKFLFDHNLIKWGWQTFAWSGGIWDSRAHVQQYNNAETLCGVSLDLDRAMVADYGQWFAFQLEEEDMSDVLEALAAVAKTLKEDRATAERRHKTVVSILVRLDELEAILSHKPNLIDFRQMARGQIEAFAADTARESE